MSIQVSSLTFYAADTDSRIYEASQTLLVSFSLFVNFGIFIFAPWHCVCVCAHHFYDFIKHRRRCQPEVGLDAVSMIPYEAEI